MMTCPIGRMIVGDIVIQAICVIVLIVFTFLEAIWWLLLPAAVSYAMMWESIGEYRQHEAWHHG